MNFNHAHLQIPDVDEVEQTSPIHYAHETEET